MNARLARLMLPALVFGIAGCATDRQVSPPSLTELAAEMGVADRYASAGPQAGPAAAEPQRPDLAKWWQSFDDPVLDALIERGRRDNLDMKAAALAGGKGGAPAIAVVRGTVEADIARAYIALRGRQTMIEDVRDFLTQRQSLIPLARFRVQAGLVTPLDVARAVAGRDEAAARIVELEARNRQDAGRIAVLTGQAPQAPGDLLDGTARLPAGPANVALGRPSDLPVRQLSTRTPAGQIAYKRAFLKAVQAVEAQNTAFQYAGLREAALLRAATSAEAAARLGRRAYAQGLADYSTLEQVEADLLSTRTALRQTQARRALALIGLYVALGGGPVETAGD